jgi:glycosyltransferase involved in cell wall biosynthesis
MLRVADRPQLVVATPGDPFDPGTWSGSSAFLVRALERAHALAGAIDASSHAVDRLEQLASFSPNRARWRQRYHSRSSPASGVARSLRSGVARRRLPGQPEAVLHVGAWALLPGRVRASFHDGNLAVSLARGEPLLDPRSRSVRRALEADRRFYEQMDVLLPMSEWLRRSFVEDYGQEPAKVVTVGAGANLHELPDLPERTYEQPRFLFVGKQWERKGGPQLLEAFRLVYGERPEAELWIVGPEQPIAGTGVRFFGRISRANPEGERRLGELYAGATAFAMPSLYEPFGIVFLEAMAYGLACVASDRCAMPEIVADGVSGFTVDPHDVDALGQRLLELTDPARARAFGQEGRRRLVERFTWDGVAERIVEAISTRTAP